MATIESVALATLLPGAELLDDPSACEVWKGMVRTNDGADVAIYLKLLQPTQIINEVACAILGRAVGLPVPRPFLVWTPRSLLPSSTSWGKGETNRIGFGSQAMTASPFEQIVSVNAAAKSRLVAWSALRQSVIFDEWIANGDRHDRNLLFDGADFWLVDHGQALTGPFWSVEDLRAKVEHGLENKLYDLLPIKNSSDALKLIEIANLEAKQFLAAASHNVQSACRMEVYASAAEADGAANFLRERALKVPNLLAARSKTPMLELR